MDARLTRDGLLRLELRLTTRQRQGLYERFEQLRKSRGEPLTDHECLSILLSDFFLGERGLVPSEEGEDSPIPALM